MFFIFVFCVNKIKYWRPSWTQKCSFIEAEIDFQTKCVLLPWLLQLELYVRGVWFLLRRKQVMQETISVFKDPPVQVWELSPSTRRSDTHTQTHTQHWSACACRLSSKTLRSFEGPSGSRGLLCFTHVSVPHWGQHSTSADKYSETPWKVQNGARNRLFLMTQSTKMWKNKILVINVLCLEHLDLWRHLIHPLHDKQTLGHE